jgi:hypothetical protein
VFIAGSKQATAGLAKATAEALKKYNSRVICPGEGSREEGMQDTAGHEVTGKR